METALLKRWEWAGVVIALCLLFYWVSDPVGMIRDRTSAPMVTYTSDEGPALVSSDGRSVSVGGFSGECSSRVALDAQETTAQVRLRLKWTRLHHAGACNASMGPITDLRAALRAPLGHRALVDATTGQGIAWFDAGRILRPTRLPAGYVPMSSSLLFPTLGERPTRPSPAAYIERYRALFRDDQFVIVEVRGPLGNAEPGLEPRHITVTVRGHRGQADTYSLRWVDGDLSVYMSLGEPGLRSPARTAADLVAVADSAP